MWKGGGGEKVMTPAPISEVKIRLCKHFRAFWQLPGF